MLVTEDGGELLTDYPYELTPVPVSAGRGRVTAATDAYVARERERFVDDWRTLCRIPSVSGERAAIAQAADWIEERLARCSTSCTASTSPATGRCWRRSCTARATGRLAALHALRRPAAPATRRRGRRRRSRPSCATARMWARGACDDKSDVTARLQGLEAWLSTLDGRAAVHDHLPGRPRRGGRLPRAAGRAGGHTPTPCTPTRACGSRSCATPTGGRASASAAAAACCCELRLDLLRADQHTAFASVVRSAPLELMARDRLDARRRRARSSSTASTTTSRADRGAAGGDRASIPLPTEALALDGVSPHPPLPRPTSCAAGWSSSPR